MENTTKTIEDSVKINIKLIKLDKKKSSMDDLRFKKSGFKKCIQCGRCTASCPAASFYPDYKPRDLMRKFTQDEFYTDEVNEIIWKCSQCYSCRARCPRNCKAGLGVLALQSHSYLSGNAPPEINRIGDKIKHNLYNKGETFLPSTLSIDIETEFGQKIYHRCLNNSKKREDLGYLSDDSRNIPIHKDL